MSQANSEQDLIDLNQKLGEAEKTKNEVFLRSILSEALRFRRASGTIIDKAIFLDDLNKPGNTTDQLTSDDIAVQFYEDKTAVVTLKVHVQGMRCGRELNGMAPSAIFGCFTKNQTNTYPGNCTSGSMSEFRRKGSSTLRNVLGDGKLLN